MLPDVSTNCGLTRVCWVRTYLPRYQADGGTLSFLTLHSPMHWSQLSETVIRWILFIMTIRLLAEAYAAQRSLWRPDIRSKVYYLAEPPYIRTRMGYRDKPEDESVDKWLECWQPKWVRRIDDLLRPQRSSAQAMPNRADGVKVATRISLRTLAFISSTWVCYRSRWLHSPR